MTITLWPISFYHKNMIDSVGEFEEQNTNFIRESSTTLQEQFTHSHKSLLGAMFCFLFFLLLTLDTYNTNDIGIYSEWNKNIIITIHIT